MSSNLKYRMNIAVGSLAIMVIVFSSKNICAAVPVRWCGTWPSLFEDASGTSTEEDVYTSTQATNRIARYSRGKLRYWNRLTAAWVYLADYYLTELGDGKYCTVPVMVQPGTTYRFTLLTRLKSGNRTIVVVHDTSSFESPEAYGYNYDYLIPGGWTGPGTHTIDLPVTTMSKQTSMAVLAARVLELADDLDFPDDEDESIVVKLNADATCNNDKYAGYINGSHCTCIRSNTSGVKKFLAGHELGHVIASMEGYRGLNPVGYLADCPSDEEPNDDCYGFFDPPEGPCRIPNMTTRGHNIQSREYTQAAYGEAFAHFIGSILFNYREYGASFNYRKDLWVDPDGPGGNDGWPEAWSHFIHWEDQHKWMEGYCKPPGTWPRIFGVERDWAEFFWQVWAHGSTSQRFNVSHLVDAFKDAKYTRVCCKEDVPEQPTCYVKGSSSCNAGYVEIEVGRIWADIVANMDDQASISPTQRLYFEGLGSATGVTY